MPTLLVLAIIGFLAQLVDGALGMAYGATSATLVLSAGYSPVVASASVHLAEIGTTFASGASHWRFGNVDWRTVRHIGIPGAVGAFAGALVLGSVPAEFATPWMAGILLALGAYVLARFALGRVPRRTGRVRRRLLVPLGLVGGFVDATGGGGWGPVTTPTLLSTGRMEPRKVVGSVDTSEFVVAVAASSGFLLALGTQVVAMPVLAGLLIGGLAAAPLAAWLVQKITARLLGTLVGGLIVLTNARTLLGLTDEPAATRGWTYAAIVVVWAAAVTFVVHAHRREGTPLLEPRRREPLLDPA
ncbi:MAG TPA: sulfite exporter TauE/SafE family protein [Gaiellaceae bacterium]|nr:sulfite exporter TauE/SafE family protein [Gaiellaceae bacterium]